MQSADESGLGFIIAKWSRFDGIYPKMSTFDGIYTRMSTLAKICIRMSKPDGIYTRMSNLAEICMRMSKPDGIYTRMSRNNTVINKELYGDVDKFTYIFRLECLRGSPQTTGPRQRNGHFNRAAITTDRFCGECTSDIIKTFEDHAKSR